MKKIILGLCVVSFSSGLFSSEQDANKKSVSNSQGSSSLIIKRQSRATCMPCMCSVILCCMLSCGCVSEDDEEKVKQK